MAVLIDTSVLISWERRGLAATGVIAFVPNEPSAISSITALELLLGVHRANTVERRRRREAFVEDFFAKFQILPFELAAARVHARIGAALSATGRSIGANDLIIAATALAHGYDILTENPRDFARVPGLVVRRPNWS